MLGAIIALVALALLLFSTRARPPSLDFLAGQPSTTRADGWQEHTLFEVKADFGTFRKKAAAELRTKGWFLNGQELHADFWEGDKHHLILRRGKRDGWVEISVKRTRPDWSGLIKGALGL